MFWKGGGVGQTSDLKWEADETLLLVSLYFFGKKLGWGGLQLPQTPGFVVPLVLCL